MKKILNIFDIVTDFLGNALFVAMALILILQVFARFVIRVSIPWTEELGRLLFMYVVFVGAGIAAKKGSHLVIDTLSSKLPAKAQKPYKVFLLLCTLACTAVFLIGSIQMVSATTNRYFSSMRTLPTAWMYAAPAIGFALMLLYFLLELGALLTGKDKEAE